MATECHSLETCFALAKEVPAAFFIAMSTGQNGVAVAAFGSGIVSGLLWIASAWTSARTSPRANQLLNFGAAAFAIIAVAVGAAASITNPTMPPKSATPLPVSTAH